MSAGTVVFDGSPVASPGSSLRALRRRVQMIFQDPTGALNPRHTIYEAVAEGIRIHKVAGDEPTLVADALAPGRPAPAERYLRRYPHEVSGGQRQRVLIAGAMALGPQLLLADEPVASLDASIRGEILALMRSLVDEHGMSIIAVTHDLGLAWNIADRVAVMYLGRIVELGATEQVLPARSTRTPGPCCRSCPRSSRAADPRPARRPTPADPRRAAGSTRAARWSPRVGRPSSESSSRARPSTSTSSTATPVTSPRATPCRSPDPQPVLSGSCK